MESRARASGKQFSTLLEFMESHGDITRPQQGALGRARAEHLWQRLSNKLNSVGDGVQKTPDKWKKVWADWKSKTKKKALTIRRHASANGDGPRSTLSLTTFEERVLGIMGAIAVEVQPDIDEQGFNNSSESFITAPIPILHTTDEDEPTSPLTWVSSPEIITADTLPPSTRRDLIRPSTSHTHFPLSTTRQQVQSSTAREQFQPSFRREQVQFSTTRTRPRSTRRLQLSPRSLAASTHRSTMRARRRHAQTLFDRATSEFVAIEQRRLALEELRERNNSRRIDAEVERNNVLSRFADLAASWLQHYLAKDNTDRLDNLK